MLGLVLIVLIIGALLASIFGKGIGQLFVMGTVGIASLIFLVILVLLSPLIWGFFTAPSPGAQSSANISYSSPSAPPYQAHGDSTGGSAAPPAAPRPFDNVRSPFDTAPTNAPGATLGITTEPADPRLSAQFSMRSGYGAHVLSVVPGGPAEQAGLQPGDFIQAMDDDPLTADHTLADYAARKGAGQSIMLSLQHVDNGLWVHKWITVTPR